MSPTHGPLTKPSIPEQVDRRRKLLESVIVQEMFPADDEDEEPDDDEDLGDEAMDDVGEEEVTA